MKKLLWTAVLVFSYVWVVTSGHDQFLLETGKKIYQALILWFEGAEIDTHFKKEPSSKKKSRRWD